MLLVINYSGLTAQTSADYVQQEVGIDIANYHEFEGKVFTNQGKAEGVTIKVFEGNECSSTYDTKPNGKFYFTAETEKYYTLQFEKAGYVTKRVVIKTHNTKDVENYTKPYQFDITLDEEFSDIDYSLHDFPMAIIEFNVGHAAFEFNKKYTKQRLKELSNITTKYYANK
ncbi:MAG: hypothetical protein ACJAV5_001637 [Vicingaceae bacterium]|jgi:hypothetical protein